MMFLSRPVEKSENCARCNKIVPLVMVFLWVLWVMPCTIALAYIGNSNAKLCPPKTLEIKRVIGKYLGWKYDNDLGGGMLTFQLKDDGDLHIFASEEQAKKIFGAKKNMLVRVTYRLEQDFSHKDSMCSDVKVLQDAEIMEDNDSELMSSYDETADEQIFYLNTAEGVYAGYGDGSDFNYIAFIIDGKEFYFVCGEEQALEMFGKQGIGKRFVLTYMTERILFDASPILNFCQSAIPR